MQFATIAMATFAVAVDARDAPALPNTDVIAAQDAPPAAKDDVILQASAPVFRQNVALREEPAEASAGEGPADAAGGSLRGVREAVPAILVAIDPDWKNTDVEGEESMHLKFGYDLELELSHEELMQKFAEDLEPDDVEVEKIMEAQGERVVCGNHRAENCAACPQGQGESWCNGECEWEQEKNRCIPKPGLPALSQNNPFGCPIENGKIIGGNCRARTASIHFNYIRPSDAREPMWFYNEVYPTHTSTDTYYATNTHGYGYAGIQMHEKDSHGSYVICSTWDQDAGPAEMETCGEGVRCTGFSGEGTGAKAMWPFEWKLKTRYAVMMRRRSLPNNRVQHTCWFHAPDLEDEHPGGWKHVATANSPVNGHGVHFKDSGSFLEQWTHADSQDLRKGFYGPAYYKNEGGAWGQSRAAKFSAYWLKEREEKQQVRGDYTAAGSGKRDGADESGHLWMSTGGMRKPSHSKSNLDYPSHHCGLPEPLYAFEMHKKTLLGRQGAFLSEQGQAQNVSCGGHRATSCKACPFDASGNHHRSLCNGDCAWVDQCMNKAEAVRCSASSVSCGNHRAADCAACPQGHGKSWCNGECSWKNGNCKRRDAQRQQ